MYVYVFRGELNRPTFTWFVESRTVNASCNLPVDEKQPKLLLFLGTVLFLRDHRSCWNSPWFFLSFANENENGAFAKLRKNRSRVAQSGTGTSFSPSTSVFPCLYHSICAAWSFRSTCCFSQNNKPGNLAKISAISEIGERWIWKQL